QQADEAVPADGKDDGQAGPRRHEGHDARPAGNDGRPRRHAVPVSREAAADAGHFTTLQLRGGRVRGRDWHLVRLVTGSRELYGGDPGKAALLRRMREAVMAAGPSNGDCTLRVRVLPPGPGYRSDAPPGHPDPRLRIEVDL